MTQEPRQCVLGVDLDGVVVDFYGGIRPIPAGCVGVRHPLDGRRCDRRAFRRQVCRRVTRSDIKMLKLFDFMAPAADLGVAEKSGFRFGPKGTHTSRTIMVADLTAVFEACDSSARSADYTSAIIGENCLGKATTATRRSSRQRLAELYALDPLTPLFRVMRRLWDQDVTNRPLLALLAALARDPLLRATAAPVLALREGEVLTRPPLVAALRESVGPRLNDGILDKVARNAASSWSQSGHFVGRTHKTRQPINAAPSAVAFALYLGEAAGFRGDELLASAWLRVLDADHARAKHVAIEARRIGLIDLRTAGDVLSLSLERLDPWHGRR